MKIGRTLTELAAEIERQKESKRDFIADTRALAMDDNAVLHMQGRGDHSHGLPITPIAHRQIGTHTNIPAPYYDRMLKEAPELLATNVNKWFQKYPARRMVRELDEKMRAFMSNSYRPLDHADLLEAALPRLIQMGVQIVSCQVTETKLYVKVVDERIKADLPTGVELGKGHNRFDTVCPALVLSNSEVGMGALSVETSIWTGGCSNLMVISERSHRKAHLGAKQELGGEETYAMLSDDTKKLTDKALWAQIGDVVGAAFDRARFDAQVIKLAKTGENKITADPVKVVELVQKQYALNDNERSSVLQHLIRGGDLSQYGLHAAITRTAEDLDDYDRASEFERLGGKIVELPANDWQVLAKAA